MTKYIPRGKDFYLRVTLVNLSEPIEEGDVAWAGDLGKQGRVSLDHVGAAGRVDLP